MSARPLQLEFLFVDSPCPSGVGRDPFVRTSHGRPPASSDYLAFALAAAATAEGSAKATTASPSAKLWPGSPPKP
jgi:hypothetical protein